MSPLAWKPNAGMNEDIKAFVSDAFHRKSSKYQPGKTWQHNNMFEFLGASSEGVDDMFRPAGNVLALDLETTGVEKGSDIIQFYAKAYDKDFRELDSGLEVIGKPKASTTWEPMAQDLAEKAGLTDDVLNKGLSPEDLKIKLQAHLDDLVSKHGKFHALGSNVRFDLEKLSELLGEDQMGKYFHDEVLDTMSLSAYTTGRSGKSHLTHGLGAITQRLGITNALAHNAKYDTDAAVAAYQKMLHVMSNTKAVSVAKSVSKAVPTAIKSPGWKTAAVLAVGVGIVGMASRGEPEPVEIQGIRRPYGPHDTIHGINTSGGLTPFGSGRNTFLQFLQEANLPGDPWIRASSLGYTRQEEINRIYLEGFDDDNSSTTASGTEIHKKVQGLLARQGLITGAEVNVVDYEHKVHGSIDAMLKGDIPLEIKTVESNRDLRKLAVAKETAISQANAYAVMVGAPYSVVMYTSREDQSQYKSFKVPVNYDRYRADVERIRAGIQRLPGEPIGHNTIGANFGQTVTYLTQPNGFFFNLFSSEPELARVPAYYTPAEGIRQSRPTGYGGFEAMNPHPEAAFPGGRTQSFGALPRLKPPINHGYRNQHRHMVGYQPKAHASHPVRSRRRSHA